MLTENFNNGMMFYRDHKYDLKYNNYIFYIILLALIIIPQKAHALDVKKIYDGSISGNVEFCHAPGMGYYAFSNESDCDIFITSVVGESSKFFTEAQNTGKKVIVSGTIIEYVDGSKSFDDSKKIEFKYEDQANAQDIGINTSHYAKVNNNVQPAPDNFDLSQELESQAQEKKLIPKDVTKDIFLEFVRNSGYSNADNIIINGKSYSLRDALKNILRNEYGVNTSFSVNAVVNTIAACADFIIDPNENNKNRFLDKTSYFINTSLDNKSFAQNFKNFVNDYYKAYSEYNNKRTEAINAKKDELQSGNAKVFSIDDAVLKFDPSFDQTFLRSPPATIESYLNKYFVWAGPLVEVLDNSIIVWDSKNKQGFVVNKPYQVYTDIKFNTYIKVVGMYVGNTSLNLVNGESVPVPVLSDAHIF